METLEKIFAAKLLKVKAIKLQPTNPFTWASGWKSPFYCDNRKTLSYPELRNFVKIEIGRLIAERFPEADAIAGVATGAIPQGALVADLLNLPFVYVRSKPKDHGLENLIEGELRPGMKVVVVEDLISTGGSSLKAVEAIRNNGCEVSGMVAAYTYGFDGEKTRPIGTVNRLINRKTEKCQNNNLKATSSLFPTRSRASMPNWPT